MGAREAVLGLRRTAVAVLVGGLLGVGVAVAPSAAEDTADLLGPGAWTMATYEAENPLDDRDYGVYVPTSIRDGDRVRHEDLPAAGVPLLVHLHGCYQDAADAAVGTTWNVLAESERFVAVYPQQTDPNTMATEDQVDGHVHGGNGARCWNWFRPEHQHRGAGEPATIAGITRAVVADLEASGIPVDEGRIHLSGLSAGGIMTSVLGAAYPELYDSIGVVAGCGYLACGDADGRAAYEEMGERARVVPTMVFHGTADDVSPYAFGVDAAAQWRGTTDLADDGVANGSIGEQPDVVTHGAHEPLVDGDVTPGGGDLCVRNSNHPCLAGAVGLDTYPFTNAVWLDANGCQAVTLFTLHGLMHNWAGGDVRGSYTDPVGPPAADVLWDFFVYAAHAPTCAAPATTGASPSAGPATRVTSTGRVPANLR